MKYLCQYIRRTTAKLFVFVRTWISAAIHRFANGVFDNGRIVTDVTPEVTDVKISALLPVVHLN